MRSGGMHIGGMGGGMHVAGCAQRTSAAAVSRLRILRMPDSRTGSMATASITASTACVRRRAFAYAAYDSCWRRVWTPYGLQWVDVCGNYGY